MTNVVELSRQTCELLVKRNEKRYRGYQAQIESDPGFQEYIAQLIGLALGKGSQAAPGKGSQGKPSREPAKHKFSAGLEAHILALKPFLLKQFRTDDVLKMLEERSFTFNAKNHRKAVKDALNRMVGKSLKRVEKGLYEFA
jgi:hypothetical protein